MPPLSFGNGAVLLFLGSFLRCYAYVKTNTGDVSFEIFVNGIYLCIKTINMRQYFIANSLREFFSKVIKLFIKLVFRCRKSRIHFITNITLDVLGFLCECGM